VALCLAPGTWVRSPRLPADERQILTVYALAMPRADLGPLSPTGAWELRSPNSGFGSYSALAVLDDGTLLAASDRGGLLNFAPPGEFSGPARIGRFPSGEGGEKRDMDIESLTRDPVSGDLWAGFETNSRIERYDASFRPLGVVRPAAMRDWPGNMGPEAMVRLADGRFIVLAEGSPRWFDDGMPGLLFPADPLTGGAPTRFRFVPPTGCRAVDMAQLPDGKVLILLREVLWGIPPHFRGKLMLADPATIRARKPWRAQPLADLAAPLPIDNYEGLAVEPDGTGGVVLWLISDDNGMQYQRTLLLRLVWPANEKAHGSPRAPH
jgi:hypothetical protein